MDKISSLWRCCLYWHGTLLISLLECSDGKSGLRLAADPPVAATWHGPCAVFCVGTLGHWWHTRVTLRPGGGVINCQAHPLISFTHPKTQFKYKHRHRDIEKIVKLTAEFISSIHGIAVIIPAGFPYHLSTTFHCSRPKKIHFPNRRNWFDGFFTLMWFASRMFFSTKHSIKIFLSLLRFLFCFSLYLGYKKVLF